ncbi:hypothetical protein QQG74_00665 [Micromonospora sp. FIMYZ51]|uniref:hypothetical protein n=1 Tax=Micromonospora sp. FIMYZ51 TaxID=3051832 RepID=UPI00311F2F6E
MLIGTRLTDTMPVAPVPAGVPAANLARTDLVGEAALGDPVESLPDVLSQVVEPMFRLFGHLFRRFRHGSPRQIGFRIEMVEPVNRG